MALNIFYIIIGIIIFDYLFQLILNILNTTKWSEDLPEELIGIYEEESYKKSQQYLKSNFKFELLTSAISFGIILVMVISGAFGMLDEYMGEFTSNSILKALLFFGILALGSDIIFTPFSMYSTFVIEEKYGFNKTSLKTFFLDKIKSWFLIAIIGGALLSAILLIYEKTGSDFWIWVWIVLSLFAIFMNIFYSNLIVPLFNKQNPLEEGTLRNKIKDFAKNNGFKLNNIYTIDGSKRSSKANAYFAGLGPKKRIVLYDTLLEKNTEEEIIAVLAHEIGHYKHKHVILSMILSILNNLLVLFLLSLFIKPGSELSLFLSQALGAEQFSFHVAILAFGILYGPLSFLTGTLMNLLSRKNEYEADRFAGKHYHPGELISALKKLSVDTLSNLRPHPVYVFFHYSHPTLLQRISKLKKMIVKKA